MFGMEGRRIDNVPEGLKFIYRFVVGYNGADVRQLHELPAGSLKGRRKVIR